MRGTAICGVAVPLVNTYRFLSIRGKWFDVAHAVELTFSRSAKGQKGPPSDGQVKHKTPFFCLVRGRSGTHRTTSIHAYDHVSVARPVHSMRKVDVSYALLLVGNFSVTIPFLIVHAQ